MKFIPIGNQANLTSDRFNQSNRFSSLSPSMRLDSMGLPHTSWLTKKNGHNEINYKYWDGYDWNFIGDTSIVAMSKGSIYYSPNGLTLSDEDSPILAFARKEIDTNNRICIASASYGEWVFDELEVDYDIKWIGVFFYGDKINWTLSSSSTLIDSDSSLSSNTENASSTSVDNKDIYVATYDGEVIRIYLFNSSFILINEIIEEISDLSEFKAITLGNKVGFSYLGDNIIKYNFFDLNSYTWSFLTFNNVNSSTTSGTITGININGYMSKEGPIYPTIYISWVEEFISPYISCRIKGCSITEDEEIPYWNMIDSSSEDYLALEELINFSNVSNQITTSYKITGTCSYLYNSLGETIVCPIIFVSGAKTSVFLYKLNSYGVYRWKEYKIDLGYTGVSIPRNVVCFFDSISGKIKIIFDNNEESVVYFENETEIDVQNPLDLEDDESFEIEAPNIIILSQVGMCIAKWRDVAITDYSFIDGIDYTTNGVVLRDSVNPVAIIDNEIVLSEDLSYSPSST